TARVLFYDGAGTFLSENILNNPASTAIAFTVPSDAAFAAFNLINAVGAGDDPQNSAIAGTVKLALGTDISTPYEPYGYKIEPQKVLELPELILNVESNQADIDELLEEYEVYSSFNGVDSKIALSATYTLNNDGDFLEFRYRTGSDWVDFTDG